MESSLKFSSFTHLSGFENGIILGNNLKLKISWHSSLLFMNQSDFTLLFWLGQLEIRPVQNSLSEKALTKTAKISSEAWVESTCNVRSPCHCGSELDSKSNPRRVAMSELRKCRECGWGWKVERWHKPGTKGTDTHSRHTSSPAIRAEKCTATWHTRESWKLAFPQLLTIRSLHLEVTNDCKSGS